MRTLILLCVVSSIGGLMSAGPGWAQGARHDPNVITRDEITESAAADAYTLVERLRPRFLSLRPTVSPPNPTRTQGRGEAGRSGMVTGNAQPGGNVMLRDDQSTLLASVTDDSLRLLNRPAVFVNDTDYGDLESMRLIRTADIAEIRLYRGQEAQARFGPRYVNYGVILITTIRPR